MIKVFILGKGKQGKKVFNILKKINISVDIGNRIDYSSNIDWVYISTPNIFHFEQAEDLLKKKIKVIIEKPPTLSVEAYRYLLKKYGIMNICCVDIFTRHTFDIRSKHFIWHKSSEDKNNSSLLYRLMYHHIQILISNKIKFKFNNLVILNNRSKFIKFKLDDYIFEYKIGKNQHYIFGELFKNKTNVLEQMLKEILFGNFDFKKNMSLTLKTLQLISKIKKKLSKNILVVGGGIFGCTSAIYLSNAGYNVTLIEKNSDIFKETSYINQYRIHRGFHYPRSPKTIKQCLRSYNEFEKFFSKAVFDSKKHKCFYSISSKKSKTSAKKYIETLNQHNLKHIMVKPNRNCDTTVKVVENLYDPDLLKTLLKKRLYANDVKLVLNKNYKDISKNYDHIVNATYSNYNSVSKKSKIMQFEVCEKPVVKLPKKYHNLSHIIMDGPFMCIDPLGNTGLHVMGNVIHAIHAKNIGKYPKIPKFFYPYLNKGIIKNPKITNFKKMIKSSILFFNDIDKAIHVGSMYTVRAKLINSKYDDSRPSLVLKENKKDINIFSGKVVTSVLVAKKVLRLIN
jgi:hypothetical protein